MKIAIHQPEHFPYMGFFQKMKGADLFVILDDVQYTKNNFQNRNKFLNKNGVEEWFTVELEPNSSKKLINDIKVSNNYKWKKTIITKLQNNFKIDFTKIYSYDMLLDINVASIEYCRQKLKISTPMVFSSELNITTKSSQRLSDICKSLNATEYISGKGGKKYLDESKFNCKISYFEPNISNYYTTLQNI